MDMIIQDKLTKRFPGILGEVSLDVPNSWENIIYAICSLIEKEVEERGIDPIRAVQVKEKFGGLRFYLEGRDERVETMIDHFEYLATTVCAKCGSFKDVSLTKSAWLLYYCIDCREKYGQR
jgi:Mor family transcriptional regulator